ncbi:efflux RND transporter periplasmic adaptor subunit [Phytomonospora endophytica]|uniref:Peptidoglycan hydrolase-like protein with peptidoglycan-binding domain n=1 Tax=Phytomonospora endophytica TaxID=714109 RepID=A0A841FTL2_9ACTN|nr:peptidoglycan-binding protein [Phytomonospora endophytica]MBB6038133.1 peptidoglycan hydrolase-like protein with peptidoglycan-binding domain [Phytomonospora endophytica]GIG67404.1 peptidoglycan-binding protein [Phytomonospora endophytica]
MARARGRRIRRVSLAVAIALALGATAAATYGFGFGDDGGTADGADLPPATAEVTRQTLVDRRSEIGELGYGDDKTYTSRLTGTLTRLPKADATIKRGKALCEIDDLPVVLLYGTLPSYRELAVGGEGADVERFEKNLAELGYTGFTVDETYSNATATSVKEWQADLGLPETGTVELGRIVYAPSSVRVKTLDAALGDAVGPGTALLTYTGKEKVVTVELDESAIGLVEDGDAVRVELPDGKKPEGRIERTQTVIVPGQGDEEAETKIEVTVTVDDAKAIADYDSASVKVLFTSGQRENVLTVPVTALLALAEGGYGLEIVEGSSTRIIVVETGLFADGRVEVTGEGLAEGMTVGVPG